MLVLFNAAYLLYSDKRKIILKEPIFFLLFYVLSGIIASYSIDLVSYYLQYQYNNDKEQYSSNFSCEYFFCKYIDKPIKTVRGIYYDTINYENIIALEKFQSSISIGSSGAVSSIIMFSLITTTKLIDINVILNIIEIVGELKLIPITCNSLVQKQK
jgi:hypothetical protein